MDAQTLQIILPGLFGGSLIAALVLFARWTTEDRAGNLEAAIELRDIALVDATRLRARVSELEAEVLSLRQELANARRA